MLTIEKVVKLIDDQYFDIFKKHLEEKKHLIPLKLLNCIDRNKNTVQESDDLCLNVYGDNEKKTKQKFFQLAHHTFKLTNFLTVNYPDYLIHNVQQAQHLINNGLIEQAEWLLEITKDVAEKIEDYSTLTQVYTILAQLAFLKEEIQKAEKYHHYINTYLELQQQINSIYLYIRTTLSIKGKIAKDSDLNPMLTFFKQFENSASFAVRALAIYGQSFALSYTRSQTFYAEDNFQKLVQLQKDLKKYDYIKFPYLEELSHKVIYLKIRYLHHQLDNESIMEESDKILAIGQDVLHHQNFINSHELFSLSLKASHYLSYYLYSYRSDYKDLIDDEILQNIEKFKANCKHHLDNPIWEDHLILKHINLTTIYACFLLIGEKSEVQKSVELVENTLISYQQIPFHGYVDTLYVNLIIGYFILEDYEKLSASYKRFRKQTDGKAINQENDLSIHGFYYCGQWLSTQRKQYLQKLEKIILEVKELNLRSTEKTINDLVSYYKIPIQIQNSPSE